MTRMNKNHTMIPLKKETRSILKDIGMKGESYDDVIRKLLEKYNSIKKLNEMLEEKIKKE